MAEHFKVDDHFVMAGYSRELGDGEFMTAMVGNDPVLVARLDDKLYAVSGICTHAFSELADGELEGTRLYCALHFACFDIRTGQVLEGPAEKPLKTYEVIESDGQIWIQKA
ncbi:MAG: non-heme iron oxygenase ferredoxin subunit [Firmicutes bacterium]|nr:non-heme iron oxygenase ferredoxin subunit [Bacillota bacterium]